MTFRRDPLVAIRNPKHPDAAANWLDRVRAHLLAEEPLEDPADLLLGLYVAVTGEDLPHPYANDNETDAERKALRAL